ncbi:MAG: co-chaperone YbbN [Marinicaulis sp.]|nr:co-chaperone YbbN [Marinicaulis sp.]NNE41630.1 co-chaperone YbbN [Marinicaulis sp.]NNL90221.1 co-chaperone YbbN [Marinicaulis sp.]
MSSLIGANEPKAESLVKDATIDSFEADVIKESMVRPVIVDFWADWCGPCKQLAPALEKAVADANGAVLLVKVDIDKNQMLASQLRIQSIPTVYAFHQGRPIDGFQGALPESEIKAFVDRVMAAAGGSPSEGDDPNEDYLSAGEAAFEESDFAAAAQLFGQVAQADPTNIKALAGLARCYVGLQDFQQAKQVLETIPADQQEDPTLQSIKAAIALAESNPTSGDLASLEAKVAAEPESLDAKFDFAGALLAAGSMENAVDQLLTIIETDREWNEDAARKKLLTVFDALGAGNPLTLRARRRLSSILFS